MRSVPFLVFIVLTTRLRKKTLCFEYVFAPKAWTKMVTYIETNI